VLRAAGAAYVELVAPAGEPGTVLAFELARAAAVDETHRRWQPPGELAPPHTYPRGHYGFETGGPAGARIMVWTEQ
jgi:hypothetical protein